MQLEAARGALERPLHWAHRGRGREEAALGLDLHAEAGRAEARGGGGRQGAAEDAVGGREVREEEGKGCGAVEAVRGAVRGAERGDGGGDRVDEGRGQRDELAGVDEPAADQGLLRGGACGAQP